MWTIILIACGGSVTPSSAPEPVVAEAVTVVEPVAAAAEPMMDLSEALWDQACANSCPGPRSIELWRNEQGEIGRVLFKGDLMQCSHVMHVWYDTAGNELFSASDRPIGSVEEGARIRQTLIDIKAGYAEAETLSCPR